MKKRFMHSLFAALVLLTPAAWAFSQTPMVFEDWATSDGTQNFYLKAAVATDADAHVYVAGATLNSAGNYDILVSKYADDGSVLWSDQLDGVGHGHDAALALVVDEYFNVYVTGTTFTSSDDTLNAILIKYDVDGTRLWTQQFNGTDRMADLGTCIAYANGALYVGGITTDASNGLDFLVMKYETDGTQDWVNVHDEGNLSDVCTRITASDKHVTLVGATQTSGLDWDYLTVGFEEGAGTNEGSATMSGGSAGFDKVTALDKDADGNIYLTGAVANGTTGYDIQTVKIDTNLSVVWSATYSSSGNHFDLGQSLARDASGNVYVGGYVSTATHGTDFVTVKYSSSGTQQWAQTWNSVADSADSIKAVVVDASGNVTVTGTSWNGSSDDYHTIQYNPSGAILWQISYDNKFGYGDRPMDIAVDPDNNIVVAGQSMTAPDEWSYVTVRYVTHALVMPVDSDSVSTSLRYLVNHDQLLGTDGNPVERVRFYSNQCYPNVYMMDDTLSYVFAQAIDTTNDDTLHRVNMSFVDSNTDKKILAIDKESYFNNYYLGHIPEGRPFVSLYKHLYMKDVWDNIDVEYSSNQRGLKYYIVVHPGGEPGAIKLQYDGQDGLSVDGSEALVMETSVGDLIQPQPLAYEMDAYGELSLLAWRPKYSVSGGAVSFDGFGSWSGDLVVEVNWGYLPLSITMANPIWATYYGDTEKDVTADLDVDSDGNLYAVGETQSPNFPLVGQNLAVYSGFADAFVGRFKNEFQNLNIYNRHWFSIYGGDGNDYGVSIVAEDVISQRVYICGNTQLWTTFQIPITNDPGTYCSATPGSNSTAFVGGFDLNTGQHVWASYFGGPGGETCEITTDPDGNLYLVGHTGTTYTTVTNSSSVAAGNFPIYSTGNAFSQSINNGQREGYIAKFGPSLTLDWSTLFGGGGDDRFYAVAVDNRDHQLYVGGRTTSTNIDAYPFGGLPCPNGAGSGLTLCQPEAVSYFQDVLNGDVNNYNTSDGLLVRFDLDGKLKWSTLFGGFGPDAIHGLAARPLIPGQSIAFPPADIYITGITETTSYMTTTCSEPTSGNDGFPHCIHLSAHDQDYCNQCTGNPGDEGGLDAFIARFNRIGKLDWSTFMGGGRDDGHFGIRPAAPKIAISNDDHKYVIGTTFSGIGGSTPINISSNPSFYDQSAHGNISTSSAGDAFIFGFDTDNEQMYGSYYGGTRFDWGLGIAVTDDEVFIGGATIGPVDDLPKPPFPYLPYYQPSTLVATQPDAYFAQIQLVSVVSNEVPRNPSLSGLEAFPNPAIDEINLRWNSVDKDAILVTITDMVGHRHQMKEMIARPGVNLVMIPVKELPSGIFLISIVGRGRTESVKFVKL